MRDYLLSTVCNGYSNSIGKLEKCHLNHMQRTVSMRLFVSALLTLNGSTVSLLPRSVYQRGNSRSRNSQVSQSVSHWGPLCRWGEREEKEEEVYNFHPDDYDDWIPDGWTSRRRRSVMDRTFTAGMMMVRSDREEWAAVTLGGSLYSGVCCL